MRLRSSLPHLKPFALLLGAIASTALAGLPPAVPKDVQAWLERVEECGHWSGEEATDAERTEEIQRSVAELRCNTLESEDAVLRRKYAANVEIVARIQQAKIEAGMIPDDAPPPEANWEGWAHALPKSLAEKPVEACEEALESAAIQLAPTALSRTAYSEVQRCARAAMDAELERWRLPLKQRDASGFEQEMLTQKLFNAAVERFCGRWDAYVAKCTPTGSFREPSACRVSLFAWRARQARALREGHLAFPAASAKGTWLGAETFRPFAKELCRAPAEAWEKRQPPAAANCETQALAEMARRIRDNGREPSCDRAR